MPLPTPRNVCSVCDTEDHPADFEFCDECGEPTCATCMVECVDEFPDPETGHRDEYKFCKKCVVREPMARERV